MISNRVITVFTVFRLLTDFVCLYNYEFWLSLCKIVRSSVILLLPLLLSKKLYIDTHWHNPIWKKKYQNEYEDFCHILRNSINPLISIMCGKKLKSNNCFSILFGSENSNVIQPFNRYFTHIKKNTYKKDF